MVCESVVMLSTLAALLAAMSPLTAVVVGNASIKVWSEVNCPRNSDEARTRIGHWSGPDVRTASKETR
jgi:hypothetical protein